MATKQKKQEKAPTVGVKNQTAVAALSTEQSTSKMQSFFKYFEDAKTELGKVSWPTKKEVKATSVAVLILVVVMCFFLGIVDILLAKIIESILSMGL